MNLTEDCFCDSDTDGADMIKITCQPCKDFMEEYSDCSCPENMSMMDLLMTDCPCQEISPARMEELAKEFIEEEAIPEFLREIYK